MSENVSYIYWLRGDAHREMLLQSARSVARAHSTAGIVALVDDATPLPPDLIVHRLPDHAQLQPMVANLAAQVWFLDHVARDGDHVTFIDADTLLLRPIVFEASLGVTWRAHEGVDDAGLAVVGAARFMPYNYGVIGARVTPRTRLAFRWLHQRVQTLAPKLRDWYGNQLALTALCGPPPTAGSALVTRTLAAIGELDIEQRPCEHFNYTPATPDEDISARHLLHFKGKRRPLMSHYVARLGI